MTTERIAAASGQRDMQPSRSKRRRWLFLILAFSVLARLLVGLYLGSEIDAPPMLTDQRSYHALGQRLVAGHGFSFDRDWYPFIPADTPTAHWSFLYSLFVAAVYAVLGGDPLMVRLTQAVLGGLILPWMAYRLARQLYPDRETIGLLSAGFAAVYGYFVLYAATLMTETFYIILLLWSLEISMRLGAQFRADGPASRRDLLLLGLSLGLAALMRQSILPWVPLLFIWLLWQARGRQRLVQVAGQLLIPLVMMAALILPWTYRNYRVYDTFLLLNSNTGYAMYSAQHPMHGTRFSEFAAAPIALDVPPGNEPQVDRELLRRGIGFVLDEPGRYLLLTLDRVRAYFEFWPSPDTSLLHNLGRMGSFFLLWPFILYGLVQAWRSSKFDPSSQLLLSFVLFYSIIHVATWAMVRYRLPIDAALLPFAALGLQNLLERTRSSRAAHSMLDPPLVQDGH